MRLTIAAVIAFGMAAPACLAANASNPYGNIDPTNDAGNDTGDLQVEALNQAQIDDGPRPDMRPAPVYQRSYAYAPTPVPYAPPDAYYPREPEAYAPPPPYAAPYPLPRYAPPYGPGPYAPPGYYPPPGYAPPGY